MPSSDSSPRLALPVDAVLPEVIAALEHHANLVIVAAPGAGKTTRVPPAFLARTPAGVVVLEPRRIAARLAARRVAAEWGEEVGLTVGYQVRFEEVAGPRTRLRFVTEGVLTRRLLRDPDLAGVDIVVLDEFHERHLETDVALSLLRRLQRRRPELRLVVMSATLDAAPVAAFLDHCPVIESAGRLHPLTIHHLGYSPEPLETQVRSALEVARAQTRTGHILTFLPGAAEIRRAARACEAVAARAGIEVLPLHGDLLPAEQDRAVGPSTRRKLILATNVAESSITIAGVTTVIDSGLARIAGHSAWTGLPTLTVGRVSQASARQRAGRAGRTGPGTVLRLYAEEDLRRRPEHDAPAIVRDDLAQLCLALRAMGIPSPASLEWLDAPPAASVQRAEDLLDRLGARDRMAAELARYPLHPRLARVVVEALKRGVGSAGCRAVALLASGARADATDLLAALDAQASGAADLRWQRQVRQLEQLARPPRNERPDDDALLQSVLAGFPDRVAQRRAGNRCLLANGVGAEFAGAAPPYEFMTALDAEDRTEHAAPCIRVTARVEPEWLLELFPDRVRAESRLEWNRAAERVDAVESLLYEALPLEETRGSGPDPEAATALLAEKAAEAGLDRFVGAEHLAQFEARVAFAGLLLPDYPAALRELCPGLRSFAQLREAAAGFIQILLRSVDASALARLAPESIRLPSGRTTPVRYEIGKPPSVASRIQDLFGMRESPRIGPDKTPVVVHLLAPSRRPVQTTTDLAGFWQRLYPELRRELARRYPKHTWPERP